MDYRTVPPPTWATAIPSEWEREAHHARAMLRNATHYAPDLVGMFGAWASAWDARLQAYKMAREEAEREAAHSVRFMSRGMREEAEMAYQRATAACKREHDAILLTYPCFLETIPNRK